MKDEGIRCGGCRFFQQYHESGPYGRCWRFPKQLVRPGQWEFPEMDGNSEYCGEYDGARP